MCIYVLLGGTGDPIRGALSVLGKHSTTELCSQLQVSLLLSYYFYVFPLFPAGALISLQPWSLLRPVILSSKLIYRDPGHTYDPGPALW